jgi:hypothetical protein
MKLLMNLHTKPQNMDFAAIGNSAFPTVDLGDLIEPFEMFYDMAPSYDGASV